MVLLCHQVYTNLSGAQVLQGASLVQTGEVFYHHHLFLPDEVEQNQELLTVPTDQLNHLAERDEGRRGEGLGALGRHRDYEIDVVAIGKGEKKKEERSD